MKRRSLKIVKVNAQKSPQYRQEFVNQPINYLKIIENKEKVKYEYLNKDFDPKQDLKQLAGRRLEYPNPEIYDPGSVHQHTQQPSSYVKTPALKSDLSKYSFDIPLDSDDEDYHPQKRSFTPPRPPVVEGLDLSQQEKVYEPPSSSYTPPRPQTITHTETYSPQQTPRQTPQQTPRATPQHTPRHTSRDITPQHTPSHQQVYNYDLHTPPREDGQYSKLRDFLNGSDNDESEDDDYYARRRNHKVIDPYKYMSEDQKNFNKYNTGPPTLDELERTGEYSSKPEYMDVYKMDEMLRHTRQNSHHGRERSRSRSRSRSSSRRHSVASSRKSDTSSIVEIKPETPESIDDKKRELLTKLDMLRKKYPEQSQNIPFMTMNSSLKELEYLYYSELRKLEIDSDVNDYRTYLIGFFMITEFILGKFLRLDLEGFTQQQMLNMRRYERFLIEIGEKNYVPEGKKWPVEIRLIGFVLIQAAAFTASKMILKRTGTNLMGMFNAAVHQNQNMNNGGPKRKMKMPDIDLDDDE
jgi:hypothetical protein